MSTYYIPQANIASITVLPVIGHGIHLTSKVDDQPLIENCQLDEEFSWSDKCTKYLVPIQLIIFIVFLTVLVIMT